MLTTNPNWRKAEEPKSGVAQVAATYVNWGPGEHILPFQTRFLNEAFERKKDGTWKYRRVAMNAPRQNGKTKLLTALIIYVLYVLGGQILVTAHEQAAADKIMQDVSDSIDKHPELLALVAKRRTTAGKAQIRLSTGADVQFRSRKGKTSGMGGTFDLVIFDEAQELSSTYEGMISKALKTRRNALIVYTGTPFLPDSKGDSFNILLNGAEDDDGLYALRYGIDDDTCDITDETLWAATNPLYPGIIPRESFLTDIAIARQSGEAGIMDFRIQNLGLWFEQTIPPVIPADLWSKSMLDLPHDRDTLVYAITYDPLSSMIALSVAAYSEKATIGGKDYAEHAHIVGEIVDERTSAGDWTWIPTMLKTAPRKTTVVLDAGGLSNPIREMLPKGLNIIQLSGPEFLATQQGFVDLLNNGTFKHPDNPQLISETSNATKANSGDMWKFVPIRKGETISGLKALSEAVWYRGVNKPQPKQAPQVVYV